jgi:copper(I)-binding protein
LWARPTVIHGPETARVAANAAIYGSLLNESGRDDRIVAVSVPSGVARRAEIHEIRREGDSLRMQGVEVLELPDAGELTFEPGGRHVMLMGLLGPLREGDTFDVTFRFAQAGEMAFGVRVGEDAR